MLSRLLGLEPQDDIWFSRDIHGQVLNHWMLVVKGLKFELVRTPQGDYISDCTYVPGWTPDREREEESSRYRGGMGNGYDSWVVVRIGWTNMSKKDIDECFAAARSHYPPRLLWPHAQDLLRRFVDQFVDRHEVYWQWFIDNSDIRRQSIPQLPPPPAGVRHVGFPQRQQISMEHVHTLNMMQAGSLYAQQQNIALNNQIMQNNFNPGYGS